MITKILNEIQNDMPDKEKQILYYLIMSNPKLKKKILKEEEKNHYSFNDLKKGDSNEKN